MNPWTNWSQILIGEIGRTTGMFLCWFKTFKLSRSTFLKKNLFEDKVGFLRFSLVSQPDNMEKIIIDNIYIKKNIFHNKQTHLYLRDK